MAWHSFEKGQEYSLDEVVAACEQRIRSGVVLDVLGKEGLLALIKENAPAVVVWAPFSSRWGASPFNPNCWQTVDRTSILEAGTLISESPDEAGFVLLPGEMAEDVELREGSVCRVAVVSYERNPKARKGCIEHYGTRCVVCGFDFGETYGDFASGFVHVHHIRPLSEIGQEYVINPIEDLRPVCPNCHAVLHLETPRHTIQQIRTILGK